MRVLGCFWISREMRPEVENHARKFLSLQIGSCDQIEDIYSEIKIQCVKMFMTYDNTMKTYKNVRISFSSIKKLCDMFFLIKLLI